MAACVGALASGACGRRAARTEQAPVETDDTRFARLFAREVSRDAPWPVLVGRASAPRALSLNVALHRTGVFVGERVRGVASGWTRVGDAAHPASLEPLRERVRTFARHDLVLGAAITVWVDTTVAARAMAEALAVVSVEGAPVRLVGRRRDARGAEVYGGVEIAPSLEGLGGEEARRVGLVHVSATGALVVAGGPCEADATRACSVNEGPIATPAQCASLLEQGLSREAPARALRVESDEDAPSALVLTALFACHAAPSVARRALHPQVGRVRECTAGRARCDREERERALQTREAEARIEQLVQALVAGASDAGAAVDAR